MSKSEDKNGTMTTTYPVGGATSKAEPEGDRRPTRSRTRQRRGRWRSNILSRARRQSGIVSGVGRHSDTQGGAGGPSSSQGEAVS